MRKNNVKGQLKAKKIARLESQVDLLEAELMHLHEMLVRCGFPEGIKTLKETVNEVLAEQSLSSSQE